jgi:hypothetical protein
MSTSTLFTCRNVDGQLCHMIHDTNDKAVACCARQNYRHGGDFRPVRIDPAALLSMVETFAAALPELCERIVAAAEADPAFRALCRREGVEGGVGAAFDAARQAIEQAR